MHFNPFEKFFGSTEVNSTKRLAAENLKLVVSRVRCMQKQSSPSGCSYNPNAKNKNLDLALEQSKRREFDFDVFISKEINKLNCNRPKNSHRRQSARIKGGFKCNTEANSPKEAARSLYVKKDFKIFKSHEGVMKPIKIPNEGRSPKTSPRKLRVAEEQLIRLSSPQTKEFGVNNLNRSVRQKAEKLMIDCERLNNDMKKVRDIRTAEEHKIVREKAHLHEFLSGKAVKYQENDSKEYIDNQTDLNIMIAKSTLRGKKVWRHNHVSFITSVDRMINSMPITKN